MFIFIFILLLVPVDGADIRAAESVQCVCIQNIRRGIILDM
jgi:hypothetical protein